MENEKEVKRILIASYTESPKMSTYILENGHKYEVDNVDIALKKELNTDDVIIVRYKLNNNGNEILKRYKKIKIVNVNLDVNKKFFDKELTPKIFVNLVKEIEKLSENKRKIELHVEVTRGIRIVEYGIINAINLIKMYLKNQGKIVKIYIWYATRISKDPDVYKVIKMTNFVGRSLNLWAYEIKCKKEIKELCILGKVTRFALRFGLVLPFILWIQDKNKDIKKEIENKINSLLENMEAKPRDLTSLLIIYCYTPIIKKAIEYKKYIKETDEFLCINKKLLKEFVDRDDIKGNIDTLAIVLLNNEITKLNNKLKKVKIKSVIPYTNLGDIAWDPNKKSSNERRNLIAHVGFNYDKLFICNIKNEIYIGYKKIDIDRIIKEIIK